MLRPSAVDVTHRAPHSSDLTPQHDELLRKLDSAAREAIAKWRESGGKPISVEGTHSPTVSEAWHRLLFKRKWRISAVRIDSGDLSIVIVGDRSPEHDNLVAVFDAILSKLLGKLSNSATSSWARILSTGCRKLDILQVVARRAVSGQRVVCRSGLPGILRETGLAVVFSRRGVRIRCYRHSESCLAREADGALDPRSATTQGVRRANYDLCALTCTTLLDQLHQLVAVDMARGIGTFKILANRDIREAVKQTAAVALPPTPPPEPIPSTSRSVAEEAETLKRTRDASTDASNTLPPRKKKRKEAKSDDVVSFTRSTLPPDLLKYWHQRHRLFSRFDEGIHMDREGWWSVTPEDIAAHIAERCRCDLVVDGFCGVGGNAIQFAFTCERVIAIDISPTRLACARHNAELYGVADRIEFICADFVTWTRTIPASLRASVDVVFLSPPWGGVDYLASAPAPVDTSDPPPPSPAAQRRKNRSSTGNPYIMGDRIPHAADDILTEAVPPYDLDQLQPLPGRELLDLARTLTPHIALFLPRTSDPHALAAYDDDGATVEVEQAWVGTKMKALTAYFGELARAPEGDEVLPEEEAPVE